jgi:hypothetical protein
MIDDILYNKSNSIFDYIKKRLSEDLLFLCEETINGNR